jgi:hypothetical protein
MADDTAPSAPAPAATSLAAGKSWPDVLDNALHYAAGGGLLLIAAYLKVTPEVIAALVLGCAGVIGIKVTK